MLGTQFAKDEGNDISIFGARLFVMLTGVGAITSKISQSAVMVASQLVFSLQGQHLCNKINE